MVIAAPTIPAEVFASVTRPLSDNSVSVATTAFVKSQGYLTNAALSNVVQALARAISIGTEGANGTVSASDRQAIAGEVQGLLTQAACLHNGWAQILGAAVGGYTRAGTASMLEAPSRVSVQG